MPANTVELRDRLKAQMTSRSSVDSTWGEVEKWIGPLAGGAPPNEGVKDEASVRWTRGEIWDSTGSISASRLAASLYTSLTNPALRWLRLEWLDKDLQNDTEAAKALDDAADVLFDELSQSDFYSEIASFYQEWVRFCTGVIVAEAKKDALTAAEWKGFDFTAPPVRECYYEPDAAGAVFRFWRVLQWTPIQLVSKFKDQLPEDIKKKASNPQESASRISIAYCIFVREERMGKEIRPPVAPELRPIGTVYFDLEGGRLLGEEDGLYEMPVFIIPWERAAGSIWGNGPGIQCLPDVRYVNERLSQQRVAGEKAVDPPLAVTERGLVADPNLNPGGMTVLRSLDDVKPLESNSRFDVGEHDIADLRAQIRGHFWADELSLKLSPHMTATEVNARIDQMNRLFGPTLALLQSLGLDLLIKLAFDMLFRAGKLKFPPGVLERARRAGKGGEYSIKYQGPLSRAQRSDEVAAIERVASAASAMLKMGFQKVALVFNEEQALREIAKRLGTPATILWSEKDVKAKAKALEDTQRRAMEAEIAKSEGQAANQSAQAIATAGNGQVPQSVPAQPPPILEPPVM